MFRCRMFPGQYLFSTREYRDDRLDQVVESHGLGKTFAGGDRSRLLRGPCDFGPRQAEMPVPRRPFPGDEMHNEFAGGDVRRLLRRAQVRVLPQPVAV
jgi:hypothetical protein